MSELAKRMLQRHYKDEDGASASSGSAGAVSGASVTGNAGLSSLGQIPNGPLGVIGNKTKRKKNIRECRSCGYAQVHEAKICWECGDRLPKLNEQSMEERLSDYREKEIHLNNSTGYGWIGNAVSQIMNVMSTGHPEVLHENDGLNEAILRERLTDVLCDFEKWRLRHTNLD